MTRMGYGYEGIVTNRGLLFIGLNSLSFSSLHSL